MKALRQLFWQAQPGRALIEGWLICAGMLIPILPVVLEASPLARSLYLVLVPLVSALIAGLRMRFFAAQRSPMGWRARLLVIAEECGLALVLALGIWAIVMGLMAGLGTMDAINDSYAGKSGTLFFLIMAAPEYLGVRFLSWGGHAWNRLRRKRYVWGLTHAILSVTGGVSFLALTAWLIWFAYRVGNDITGIPAGSAFAKGIFWLSMFLTLLAALFAAGTLLFFPPITLFSFLIARRVTARVEKLAAATQSLRQGALDTRVTVQGEDEIAQLQADFNGMAADLGKSVQSLQAEKDKVWRLMDARRDLVADVSHELRNPAAIIQGYSDALRRNWQERSPLEVERDLETIQYEASRLQTILNDLLAASQLEAGRLELTLQPVEVSGLARHVVETFSGLAWGSRRVQVTLTAPEAPVYVLGDALRLEQILVNLVQNALRHTSPGGLVSVEIHPGAEEVAIAKPMPIAKPVAIEVEDTGEGIPAEDLPHIWEKYFQAGSPQRRSPGGIGLGLALVKELTEAMGGSVSVESCPGEGSVFRVTLPGCEG